MHEKMIAILSKVAAGHGPTPEDRKNAQDLLAETKTVYAWLIENGKEVPALRYRGWAPAGPCWVTDPYEALWFIRRQDAEAISAEDEDAWRITEHCFEV